MGRIATTDALIKRNCFNGDSLCPLCEDGEESATHLFCSCIVASNIWCMISRWCKISPIFAFSIQDLLLIHEHAGLNKAASEALHGIIIVACWCIWFLNKACVVRDVDIGSSGSNPCGITTVENVESLKSLIRIIPIWSSGILLFVNVLQKFPTLEAEKMNRKITSRFEIPAASFSLFMLLTITISIPFYDHVMVPFLAKFTHEPRGLNLKTRMGVGIILSIITMVVSAIVETIRRDLANSSTTVVMSEMWLVPQFVLLGLTEAFNAIG
ncbi:hypothetical protein HanXRQr2_Chr01g0043121 [Helianthus annuus]|uniref:Reverse transcriptase zinc-binding domain-containing protein n=1 Tax=Helianthus annuus TaxID=4232 RepID=A0A9K3JZC9_HELAN|nr:hypothetical protein HanXRQr2_Chr01g0043121 [Helianthus annuus]KAJ0958791.1 hypothetical protein HanPSC8_Chr01g0042781 [Helianthus annuus]